MDKSKIIKIKNESMRLIAPIVFKTKPVDISDFDNVPSIEIDKSSFSYLTYSSFNVAFINEGQYSGYFRECRPHASRYTFVKTLLEDYYKFINSSSKMCTLQTLVLEKIRDKANIDRFFAMGVKNDFNSPVSRFFKDHSLSFLIGVPDCEQCFLGELASFVQFAWGEIYLYNMSRGLKETELQTFNSNKQIATYQIAKHLEISSLIPNTRFVKLCIDGTVKIGTWMDVACGQSPEKMSSEQRHKISPRLQMEFAQLTLLDLICRQRDHRPNRDANYNINISCAGDAEALCAFDNDSPTSFFPSSRIDFTTSAATTPFVDSKGRIQMPFLSEETCLNILSMNYKWIDSELSAYLSRFQLRYLKKRIRNLQNSIQTAKANNDVVFLSQDQWNRETVEQELSFCENNHKVTYLYSFYHLM